MLRVLQLPSATLLAVLLLAGCGHKGQLVLPGQEPKKHKSSQPAPAQKAPDSKQADPNQAHPTNPQGDPGQPQGGGGGAVH